VICVKPLLLVLSSLVRKNDIKLLFRTKTDSSIVEKSDKQGKVTKAAVKATKGK
jgi:hypothetical protein